MPLTSSMSWHPRKQPFSNAVVGIHATTQGNNFDLQRTNPTYSFLLQSSLTSICPVAIIQLRRFKTQFLTVAECLKVLKRSPSLKDCHLDRVYSPEIFPSPDATRQTLLGAGTTRHYTHQRGCRVTFRQHNAALLGSTSRPFIASITMMLQGPMTPIICHPFTRSALVL